MRLLNFFEDFIIVNHCDNEITCCYLYLFYLINYNIFLGKKVLMKILKIFKHCLNLLEKNEVSPVESEGSEISCRKPTTPFELMINLSLSLHQMKVLGIYYTITNIHNVLAACFIQILLLKLFRYIHVLRKLNLVFTKLGYYA